MAGTSGEGQGPRRHEDGLTTISILMSCIGAAGLAFIAVDQIKGAALRGAGRIGDGSSVRAGATPATSTSPIPPEMEVATEPSQEARNLVAPGGGNEAIGAKGFWAPEPPPPPKGSTASKEVQEQEVKSLLNQCTSLYDCRIELFHAGLDDLGSNPNPSDAYSNFASCDEGSTADCLRLEQAGVSAKWLTGYAHPSYPAYDTGGSIWEGTEGPNNKRASFKAGRAREQVQLKVEVTMENFRAQPSLGIGDGGVTVPLSSAGGMKWTGSRIISTMLDRNGNVGLPYYPSPGDGEWNRSLIEAAGQELSGTGKRKYSVRFTLIDPTKAESTKGK